MLDQKQFNNAAGNKLHSNLVEGKYLNEVTQLILNTSAQNPVFILISKQIYQLLEKIHGSFVCILHLYCPL